MMKSVFATVLVLLGISASAASTAFSRGVLQSAESLVFGLPRGGGLFGGAKQPVKPPATKTFPGLNQTEIEDCLEHIPVFAVTDSAGQGVVLKPDNTSSVFYFFMSPMMANATLTQLKSANEDMDLRLSAFSLGKIWFNILNAENEKEVILKQPGSEEGAPATGIEYRLVPDTRDLLGARMLLTMNPEDGQIIKEGGSMTPEIAQQALKKAMTESPKFNATFNEIPVFLIAQMRIQKQAEQDEGSDTTLIPMYFSLKDMVATWQKFLSQAPADMQTVEPAINLLSLHDLVVMMGKESEIDFRNVVLMPPLPPGAENSDGETETTDPMATMGGSTLGDL